MREVQKCPEIEESCTCFSMSLEVLENLLFMLDNIYTCVCVCVCLFYSLFNLLLKFSSPQVTTAIELTLSFMLQLSLVNVCN